MSDLKTGLSKLGLTKNLVIAHASLKAFGTIDGGAEAMLNALLDSTRGVIMPTFTYKSMLNPEVGPPQNGITYGIEADLNNLAEAYHPTTFTVCGSKNIGAEDIHCCFNTWRRKERHE